MRPVGKNERFDSNTEIENTSVDFNTLITQNINISIYTVRMMNLKGKVIFPQILVVMTLSTDISGYICSTVVSKEIIVFN